MSAPVKVLIVDDSLTSRAFIRSVLNNDERIDVVGVTADPGTALLMIGRLQPDVITLDVEMPSMSGLQCLETIMRLHPTPVVMISAYTTHGSDAAIHALQMGAVDCVAKPVHAEDWHGLRALPELIVRISTARVRHRRIPRHKAPQSPSLAGASIPHASRPIFIGASTGGIEALTEILGTMPANCPPILVTQHIGATFTDSLARRLNLHCAANVIVAEHMCSVEPGTIYIAPGGETHLQIGVRKGKFLCQLLSGPLQYGHRPSVDRLFFSAASACGPNAIGVILTGMGTDGARGLLAMRQRGASTIAQDRATSVVYGMPQAARIIGAVEQELPISAIAASILEISNTLPLDTPACA